MTVYYAHPISIYGTEQEKRDIQALEKLGLEVVNPNTPENEAEYKRRGMIAFENIVDDCGALAFRAFPDGSIPAGVAREIEWARQANKPVIELPSAINRRTLSVDQTRETLKECGCR